jgi:hypothetical protein
MGVPAHVAQVICVRPAAHARDPRRRYKLIICRCFLVSVTLYLPVGLCLVSNWYTYSDDMCVRQPFAAKKRNPPPPHPIPRPPCELFTS